MGRARQVVGRTDPGPVGLFLWWGVCGLESLWNTCVVVLYGYAVYI